jgi:hypothetical protein
MNPSNQIYLPNRLEYMNSQVTRIEVIDDSWRSYVNRSVEYYELSFQDEWRTLKIFINNKD